MNYKIIDKKEFYVLEKVSVHSLKGDKNKESVPAFWAQCHNDGTVNYLTDVTADKTFIFGICYGQKKQVDTFEYSVAAVCNENAPVPSGFRKNLIPARSWAVFECVGAMPDAIQETWREIVSEFFPTSKYRPTYEMDIEVYPDGDTDSENYRSEIWVPIEKN